MSLSVAFLDTKEKEKAHRPVYRVAAKTKNGLFFKLNDLESQLKKRNIAR